MQSSAIVDILDVVCSLTLDVLEIDEVDVVEFFGLERGKKGFYWCVVPAVSLAAHALCCFAVVSQKLAVASGSILRTAITMNEHAGGIRTVLPGLPECRDGELLRDRL